MSSCGLAAGAAEVYEALLASREHGLEFTIGKTGCLGLCSREPLLEVRLPSGIRVVYGEVKGDETEELLKSIKQDVIPSEGP